MTSDEMTTNEVAAAQGDDRAAWGALTERHRGELLLHAYRLVGAFGDAEDLVQETYLRAWRKRSTFEGRATLRAWLYGIATNACLDFLAKHPPRGGSEYHADHPPTTAEIPWLEPYPDRLLPPDAAVAAKETIGLAFVVAVQLLPAKQRAALILCDVLDWSAKECAELLQLTVASVNSALQRARATLQAHRANLTPTWQPGVAPDEQQRTLLERYVSATDRGDAAGLAALLSDDVRFSMPPQPGIWQGRDSVVGMWVDGGFGQPWFGDMRAVVTKANGMPAVACYLRKAGQSTFRPMAVDLLQIEQGVITAITTFVLDPLREAFGLPAKL